MQYYSIVISQQILRRSASKVSAEAKLTFTIKTVATEIQSNSTQITSSVIKQLNWAEKFSQLERLKMCVRLKCDMDRLDFSQFGWLNFSRYSSHSDFSTSQQCTEKTAILYRPVPLRLTTLSQLFRWASPPTGTPAPQTMEGLVARHPQSPL